MISASYMTMLISKRCHDVTWASSGTRLKQIMLCGDPLCYYVSVRAGGGGSACFLFVEITRKSAC